jgi:prepilin-type processing-associated H-X9-DG protein
LLVVIGIITLLIGILLPTLSRARESSRKTACLSNLRSLGQAMFMYANAFKDRLPNGNPPKIWDDYDGANRIMVEFANTYVKSPKVFHCPSDNDPVPQAILTADQTKPDSARISYDFYFLYWAPEFGPLLTQLKGKAPLAWDLDGGAPSGALRNHSGGGNVVYADGHADWQPLKDWEKLNWPRPATQYFP